MYYTYDRNNSIMIPPPFKRYITPVFMGDDQIITEMNFSVHYTEWEPECKIDKHMHESSMEAMCCVSGNGIAEIDGKKYDFVPGSMIVAPPGIEHQIINNGNELLRVLCVFSPPITGESLRKRAMEAVDNTTSE